MNFDPENVRPFLAELDSKFELDLDIENFAWRLDRRSKYA